MHRRIFSSFSSLQLPDASSSFPLVVITNDVPGHCQISPGGQNHLSVFDLECGKWKKMVHHSSILHSVSYKCTCGHACFVSLWEVEVNSISLT